MKVLDNLGAAVSNIVVSSQDLWRSYKYAKLHKWITCFYIKDNTLYEFKGVMTPEGDWVTPANIQKQFHVTKGSMLNRKPQNDIIYICHDNNPRTINLTNLGLNRGSDFSIIAYNLFRATVFKYMLTQSKREMVLLIIVFSLFFLFVGIMLGIGLGR